MAEGQKVSMGVISLSIQGNADDASKSIENLGIIARNENCSLYEAINGGKEEEFKKIIEKLKEIGAR